MGANRMTKKLWIVWALCLMLPGGLGLSVYALQESAFQQRLDAARQAESTDTAIKDYMQMYEQWSALEPEEKADTPWGTGEYGGNEIRQRLEKGQADRLTLDLNQLSKGVSHYPEILAEVIYGPGWEQKVDEYDRQRGQSEIILTASTFLAAAGGLILAGGLLKHGVVWLIRRKKAKAGEESASETSIEKDASNDPITESASAENTATDATPTETDILSDTESPEAEASSDSETATKPAAEKSSRGYFGSRKKNSDSKPFGKSSIFSPAASISGTQSLLKETTKDSYFGWAVDEDEPPVIEKLMTSEPLTRELSELTEEVSAIRQFAAQQQDQVRKLQDGYDWMIIRRFCQRIIRCVDNIEDRLERLQEAGDEAADYLQDIRDELIFALESSGVEQFTPDLKTPFKGMEKYAEAVRDRIVTDEEDLFGSIAEIIRPGYQYLVNDDEVKIIRCAQVKLYDIQKPS